MCVSQGGFGVRNGVPRNTRQATGQCDGGKRARRLWMRETGGQILPCFARGGTYCRETRPFGIRKPLIYRAFDRGTALARTLA
jgi:hypothetical protein